MQLQVTNIHRRSNGTIDTDVYRRKSLPAAAGDHKPDLASVRTHLSGRLIGAIAILVSFALLLSRNPVPQGAASTFDLQGLPAVRIR